MAELATLLQAAVGPSLILPTPSPAANMPNTRAALAAIKAGTATSRFRVADVGDSITDGVGSGIPSSTTVGASTDCRRRGWSSKSSSMLTDVYGIPSASDSFFGDGYISGANLGAAWTTADPRISLPAGWLGSNAVVAGGICPVNTTDTSSFTFYPDGIIDTAIITVINISGGAVLNITINPLAGSSFSGGSINTAASASSLSSTTVALGAPGQYSISIAKAVAATNGCLASIECYNSTIKSVDVLNMGASSWNSGMWNSSSTPYSPINGLKFYAPNLTRFMLGVNGWVTSSASAESISTFTTNMTALVGAAKLSGEAMLIVPPPSAIASALGRAPRATQQSFHDTIVSLAGSLGCALVDTWATFGTYALGDARGWYADGLHAGNAGHGRIAAQVDATMVS